MDDVHFASYYLDRQLYLHRNQYVTFSWKINQANSRKVNVTLEYLSTSSLMIVKKKMVGSNNRLLNRNRREVVNLLR